MEVVSNYVPVQTVYIEHLCDPHQRGEVVGSIIHEEEEPEVDLNSRFSVTWGFLARII